MSSRVSNSIELTNRISDPGVHRNIRKFHTAVTAADVNLHEICSPINRSHVALDTFNMDDGAEESVVEAVRKVVSEQQGWRAFRL